MEVCRQNVLNMKQNTELCLSLALRRGSIVIEVRTGPLPLKYIWKMAAVVLVGRSILFSYACVQDKLMFHV